MSFKPLACPRHSEQLARDGGSAETAGLEKAYRENPTHPPGEASSRAPRSSLLAVLLQASRLPAASEERGVRAAGARGPGGRGARAPLLATGGAARLAPRRAQPHGDTGQKE